MNHEPRKWSLQEAKAKFSEVVRRAQTEGPQMVTVHGREAVVISKAPAAPTDISKLSGQELIKSLRQGPLFDFEIPDWETDGDFRDIAL